MATLKLSSLRGVIPSLRTGLMTLLMVASVLLASCIGAKTSSGVVSQGSTNATSVNPGTAENALLADMHGLVEVKTGEGQWALAQPEQALTSGQHLRTGALSNVTLAFYDGSRVHLGAETEIALDALDAGVVQMTQVSGESQYEVTESNDSGSHYAINTPAGSGSTAGANFTVMVLPSRLTQFWVEVGAVSVVNENVTVVVAAGQTTANLVGQPPLEPAFRFSGEGQVMQISAGNGGRGGLAAPLTAPRNQGDKVTLCHATGSATNPYVEITVSVEGATHGHAKHSGDIIPAPDAGCPTSLAKTSTQWNIAGETFVTGDSAVVFGNPEPGDWVRFEGRQKADGSRSVDQVVLVSHNPENQFAFIGKVESISATTWIISSRVVQVNEATTLDAGLKAGDNVQVAGEMTKEGTFWATRLRQIEEGDSIFRFAGVFASVGKDVWSISGIKVTVGMSTTLNGDFVVGNPVFVEGVIKEDGTWLATSIDLVTPEAYRFEFVGVVQNLSPWVVSGVGFDVADWTEIDADIKAGDQVRVTGMVSADGIWVAERIERLDLAQATRFDFFGPVLSLNPWNVNGVLLKVDERTAIQDGITLGEMVKVTGWILEDGTWLATEIKHTGLHLGQGCFLISSVVKNISGEQIILQDGQTLVRGEGLEVQGDLKEASLVRYQACVDKVGQVKIGYLFVVHQLAEPPLTSNEGGKVVICHIPPGNPRNQHTIEVGQPAVSAHLAHGDTLGACSSQKNDKKPKP